LLICVVDILWIDYIFEAFFKGIADRRLSLFVFYLSYFTR
jgi:hypothetical protein